jgi:hypothetical protein
VWLTTRTAVKQPLTLLSFTALAVCSCTPLLCQKYIAATVLTYIEASSACTAVYPSEPVGHCCVYVLLVLLVAGVWPTNVSEQGACTMHTQARLSAHLRPCSWTLLRRLGSAGIELVVVQRNWRHSSIGSLECGARLCNRKDMNFRSCICTLHGDAALRSLTLWPPLCCPSTTVWPAVPTCSLHAAALLRSQRAVNG